MLKGEGVKFLLVKTEILLNVLFLFSFLLLNVLRKKIFSWAVNPFLGGVSIHKQEQQFKDQTTILTKPSYKNRRSESTKQRFRR